MIRVRERAIASQGERATPGWQSRRALRFAHCFAETAAQDRLWADHLPRLKTMATIAKAVVPANAAKMSAGCGGANLTKTESSIEAIADGEGKIAA